MVCDYGYFLNKSYGQFKPIHQSGQEIINEIKNRESTISLSQQIEDLSRKNDPQHKTVLYRTVDDLKKKKKTKIIKLSKSINLLKILTELLPNSAYWDSYRGGFKNDYFEGQGILHFKSDKIENLYYQGEFSENVFSGNGLLNFNGNVVYVGSFKNGVFHGYGHLYSVCNIDEYHGDFVNGKFHGQGRLRVGDVYYEGDFYEGSLHGYAKCEDKDKQLFYGEWIHGVREGVGAVFFYQKNSYLKGIWKNNVLKEGNYIRQMHEEKFDPEEEDVDAFLANAKLSVVL